MEALGVNITIPPPRIADCLREIGIAFMFAPAMHSATKHVQPARKDLRPLRSVFNLLGPLTNPARASAQVVGVYSGGPVEKLAQALKLLGCNVHWWFMAKTASTRFTSAGRPRSRGARRVGPRLRSHAGQFAERAPSERDCWR
jgi:anthranilate phosphoribosyltransferase